MMLALALTAALAGVVQADISAPGPDGALKGTFTTAGKAGAPVVLIIPGSGPTDRDGNSSVGLKAASYRLLAEELAAKGVSSVRIDKRGMFASAGAVPNANAVTIEDYARDVRAWVESARQRTGAKCVWLLGHSEGGLVALEAAQRDEGICGLVLVATAGRPLGDVLKDQLRANPANAPLLDQANAAVDTLAAGKRVDEAALPPPLAPLFRPAIQGFLISAFALDPAKLISNVRKPVLIVQGERDIQVSVTDAQALRAAAPNAVLALLPDTNHVLKQVMSDDRGANVATYADPNLPLAPNVTQAIATFVTNQRQP
jgi:pimeloyl-ACP methyl ester carboxylesterase